jgi:hypothetical protein
VSVVWDRFDFSYEDGPQNAETLMVHPATGDVYIVTKAIGQSVVYRMKAPQTPDQAQVLSSIATLDIPNAGLATGGAIHPTCERFILRTYDGLYEFIAPAGAPFESAFAATPAPLPVASEPQGEAVTYLPDGKGYATASEGAAPMLHVSMCD